MPPKRMKPEIALEFKDVTIEIKVFNLSFNFLKFSLVRNIFNLGHGFIRI